MQLKKYQQNAVDTLKTYLHDLSQVSARFAFMGTTERPYNSQYFGETPFICIKIPTGGGKTLVGCHAVGEIMSSVLQNKMDCGIVMWFVPSEAIKAQTLKKFNDRNDAHRRVLDEAFENRVRIFSNEEALHIRKEDVEDNLCVLVSSLDAFRKEKALQKKYKVYQENGSLLSFFEDSKQYDGLETDGEGTVINSLANVVRINNPLVVVDEGHKTTSKLSIDVIKDLNPSFIIEYTATPRDGSNILVDISPSDLKEEQMVKIPIVLESSTQWQNSVLRGIEKRNELEKVGKKNTGEYIRPITLIQAQPKSKVQKNITVEQIREFLLEAKIPNDQIAIKTSERNDLEGVNLLSKQCKIRYIITVSALAEGWDCSFAYVLVSVANVGAKIAVEQIIGRIIRMPYAKKKKIEDLNRSYIFASARNFNEAASSIISGLEHNGYSKLDIVNASSKKAISEEPRTVERAIDKDLAIPLVSLHGEKLTFEELVGEDFELAKQNAIFKFDSHYDSDGRAIIDIQDDNKWFRGKQLSLNLPFRDRNVSKSELVQWLDKRLRFTLLSKSDKVSFLNKAIDLQLKDRSLPVLSVNRYVLRDRLEEVIVKILEEYAKKRFQQLMSKGKISLKSFEGYPKTITLKSDFPQEFNKNYYERVDVLNSEESKFIQRLDLGTLPNVDFWIRNREKQDPFFIQGWKKGKFYPDFVVVTKKGKIIALEWKGADRVSNEDTEYKVEIANIWAKLGKGKLAFFLVHNGNVEKVLDLIKRL